MPVFSYQSDLLTPAIAESSSLNMLLGKDGCSLAVKGADGKTLALKSWQFLGPDQQFQAVEPGIRKMFGEEKILGWNLAQKKCSLACAHSTLVPRRLFSEETLSQYFKLLLRDKDERAFGFEKLEAFDCYLVWSAESALLELHKQYFSLENTRHLAATLLRAYAQLSPEEGYAVFANLRNHKVQIGVFERRNLVFFNAFEFSKPSDLLYFVLLAYKQFDLDPLAVPLTLSGTLLEDSEIFKLLSRYISPLRFPPLPTAFQVPEAAKNLPAHYWFDLSTL